METFCQEWPGAPEVQVTDFVAGMTDRYAIKTYEELFVPRVWSVS